MEIQHLKSEYDPWEEVYLLDHGDQIRHLLWLEKHDDDIDWVVRHVFALKYSVDNGIAAIGARKIAKELIQPFPPTVWFDYLIKFLSVRCQESTLQKKRSGYFRQQYNQLPRWKQEFVVKAHASDLKGILTLYREMCMTCPNHSESDPEIELYSKLFWRCMDSLETFIGKQTLRSRL